MKKYLSFAMLLLPVFWSMAAKNMLYLPLLPGIVTLTRYSIPWAAIPLTTE